jgi:hypothetical protein
MQNCHLNKIACVAGELLCRGARKPYKLFFFLVAIWLAFAAWTYFAFQKKEDFLEGILPIKIFDAQQAQKYRQVFLEIDRRQEDYARVAFVYPDAFMIVEPEAAPEISAATSSDPQIIPVGTINSVLSASSTQDLKTGN